MPRYSVTVVANVWLEKEVIAPDREAAENKVTKQAEHLLYSNGFSWLDGNVQHCGTTNMSLANKILKPTQEK